MPLNDPIGSNAPDVLLRNASDLDKIVNGSATPVTLRLGKVVQTVESTLAQLSADAAASKALMDADVASVEGYRATALTAIQADIDYIENARVTGGGVMNTYVAAVDSQRIASINAILADEATVETYRGNAWVAIQADIDATHAYANTSVTSIIADKNTVAAQATQALTDIAADVATVQADATAADSSITAQVTATSTASAAAIADINATAAEFDQAFVDMYNRYAPIYPSTAYGVGTLVLSPSGSNQFPPRQVVVYNGQDYVFKGLLTELPYSLSQPWNPAKWIAVGDAMGLRTDLAGTDGVLLVGNALDKRGGTMTGALRIADGNNSLSLVVGSDPIGTGSGEWPSTTSKRDAVTIARTINKTDCHAVADKSIIRIDAPVDSGFGYGTFDSTTTLYGSYIHNHIYSFQDRVRHKSTAALENQVGLYSRPENYSSGNILSRRGVDIFDVVNTGTGGTVANVGVQVRNLTQTSGDPISFLCLQTSGYGFFSSGTAINRFRGRTGIGGAHDVTYSCTVQENAEATAGGLLIRVAAGKNAYYSPLTGYFRHEGDAGFGGAQQTSVKLAVAAPDAYAEGLRVTKNTGYAIRTVGTGKSQFGGGVQFGANSDFTVDNAYSIGTAISRASVIFAGTGSINTSDRREKQQICDLSESERRVAVACKGLLRKFKFNDAVAEKGDGARWHFGVIAQDVAAAFAAEGLNAEEYGIFCHDKWDDKPEVYAQGELISPEVREKILVKPEVRERGELIALAIVDKFGNVLCPAQYAEGDIIQHAEYEDGEVISPATYGRGVVIQPAIEAGERMGIRYDELLAFVLAAL